MPVKVFSCSTIGYEGRIIEVEVDILKNAIASFTIVGLPDTGVQESKERVRSAIKNTGAMYPVQRKVVNLAPADIHKHGPLFDLPIAIGILAASSQFPTGILKDSLFFGELALDGGLRSVAGALPITACAKDAGFKRIFLPAENAQEAALIDGIEIMPVSSLEECLKWAFSGSSGGSSLQSYERDFSLQEILNSSSALQVPEVTFGEIKGQIVGKRALQIAAAGGHHVILIGPPGGGKTLLARAFQSILPPLSTKECIETTKIHSLAALLSAHEPFIKTRPFRAPHHTASQHAIIGGGALPSPGEISLAHNGVLFLDEMGEFPSNVLETLRQPLEDGTIQITRAKRSVKFPARFTLIAATNPCPCGFYNDPTNNCKCSSTQINRYQKKLSGPLLDRIDLFAEVLPTDTEIPGTKNHPHVTNEEFAQALYEPILKSIEIQYKRSGKRNAHLLPRETDSLIKNQSVNDLLEEAVNYLKLSMRSRDRVIKVARTIADLEPSEEIREEHIAEALQFRPQLNITH